MEIKLENMRLKKLNFTQKIKGVAMSKNGIEFYYNVIDNPDELIEKINQYTWTKPENVKTEDRSNSVIYLQDKELQKDIFEIINKSINSFLETYRNLYFLPELTYFTIEALKYEPGEKYVMHYDDGSKHVSNRVTSCVIYLNDNYEGGEIEFANFDIKIKPIKNSMVLFPSNYPYMHIAHQVNSGVRYAINIFLEYK
jgi:Rps23 Pro-64 3,4-dihydroxylase Tpa1-like proline 4-hydroxylase